MKRTRATIVVEVDLDSVPGWGHEAEDFASLVRRHLDETVPHYGPTVRVTDENRPTEAAT